MMKKIILTIIVFLNLLPYMHKGTLHLSGPESVFAQGQAGSESGSGSECDTSYTKTLYSYSDVDPQGYCNTYTVYADCSSEVDCWDNTNIIPGTEYCSDPYEQLTDKTMCDDTTGTGGGGGGGGEIPPDTTHVITPPLRTYWINIGHGTSALGGTPPQNPISGGSNGGGGGGGGSSGGNGGATPSICQGSISMTFSPLTAPTGTWKIGDNITLTAEGSCQSGIPVLYQFQESDDGTHWNVLTANPGYGNFVQNDTQVYTIINSGTISFRVIARFTCYNNVVYFYSTDMPSNIESVEVPDNNSCPGGTSFNSWINSNSNALADTYYNPGNTLKSDGIHPAKCGSRTCSSQNKYWSINSTNGDTYYFQGGNWIPYTDCGSCLPATFRYDSSMPANTNVPTPGTGGLGTHAGWCDFVDLASLTNSDPCDIAKWYYQYLEVTPGVSNSSACSLLPDAGTLQSNISSLFNHYGYLTTEIDLAYGVTPTECDLINILKTSGNTILMHVDSNPEHDYLIGAVYRDNSGQVTFGVINPDDIVNGSFENLNAHFSDLLLSNKYWIINH